MAEFAVAAQTGDVGPNQMIYVTIAGKPICIAHVGGQFYALSDICSHAECNISEGDIEGDSIVCPCHDSAFDVRTGEPNHPPATEPIQTFEVKIEGEDILILI